MSQLLADFLDPVNQFSNGGIETCLQNTDYLLEGALVMAPCNTLAPQWLGGVNESVAFAFKSCQSCDITAEAMLLTFAYTNIQERDPIVHSQRCATLEGSFKRNSKILEQNWTKIQTITDIFSKPI